MLVDAANKANHKDCSIFSKYYAMRKKYEDHADFILNFRLGKI